MQDHWISYFYLYGVGGVLFFGVIILALNKKVISPSNSSDKKLLVGFVSAYFLYALLHGVWNLKAIGAMG